MAVYGKLVWQYSASMWISPSDETYMPGISDKRSLAHLIDFCMILKNQTFLLWLKNWDIHPQVHADPFYHWEWDYCYHTSRSSGQKLCIWHCVQSSSYGKHFPLLTTSKITFFPFACFVSIYLMKCRRRLLGILPRNLELGTPLTQRALS